MTTQIKMLIMTLNEKWLEFADREKDLGVGSNVIVSEQCQTLETEVTKYQIL